MTSTLPGPSRERFQPLRSGMVNLYRYDDQEFWFDDGHLLLRGNNGTGKSRVLALQLPFLFDGEVAPHRMEPDADGAKRVEWNLLMGGRYPDRLGYTWLEFGRRAPEVPAGEEFVTLGCGLTAVAGKGLTGRWFFVSHQRVGRDLFLIAPGGQALSRERLSEAIGDRGAVYTTAAKYREAVDQALFSLGQYRYEALINLLIQLRQPQLSRQLDEERLSRALSEALPPPSPPIVADVAEAFRSLETDEETLAGFRAASEAVEQFLAEYRRYAQIASRRRATAVRTRHSAYEAAMRRQREAERELTEAQADETTLLAQSTQARIDEEGAAATAEALGSSPAMQDAHALKRAREAAARATADVRRGDEQATRHAEQCERRDRELAAARADADSADEELVVSAHRLRDTAGAVGVLGRHDEIAAAALVLPLTAPATSDHQLVRQLTGVREERRRALRHLRQLGEDLRRAQAELERAEATAGTLTADVDEAAEAQKATADLRDETVQALLASYRGWVAACQVLAPAAVESIVDPLLVWAEQPGGHGPVAAAAATALAVALDRTATERAAVEARLTDVQAKLTLLHEERQALSAGGQRPPAPPPTRDVAGRLTRAGAPLWCLVDFDARLPVGSRAGLEAALEAAGILDAWVTPEGRLIGRGEQDVLLIAEGEPLPAGTHLGDALLPAIDRRDPRTADITDDAIAGLLARVGLGSATEAPVWVDLDGRFRLGPLDGRYQKATPEHIGEGARAASRRRRLDEIYAEIAALDDIEQATRIELRTLDQRRLAAQQEARTAPEEHAVRNAAADLEGRGRTLHVLRTRLAEAQARTMEARVARDARRMTRDQAALDLGVPGGGDNLEELEEALARYAAEIAALGPALSHARAARGRAEEAAVRLAESQAETTLAVEHLVEARALCGARMAERDVLEASVGLAAEEILTRHAEAQSRVRALKVARQQLGQKERAALERRVHARDEVERTSGLVQEEERARDDAAASLARLGGARLLGVAMPSLAIEAPGAWSVTRTVEVARALETALERVDATDGAWERSQKGVYAHVQTLEQSILVYGHQATTTQEDDLVVVEMPFQGRVHGMAEFGEILAAEVTNRQMLLSAREREVLENHLVGEVSAHLHDRLHAAERLVREMNQELTTRPMSTGMTLRFSWEPLEDGPPGLVEARRRLMRSGGTWSPAEREALGTFLSKRIDDVRAAGMGGTWQEHLAEALDYRRWHKFGVERLQDGVWRPLTRRTHGTGSGGEKAVALTLPQFAAAAAHYRSADRRAPRLILLDEVFVGVDSDMRSKCMGLLATFDLDFVMTSEREWGCYGTLPGVAIYQLATRPEIDAIGVTRFVWNGRERLTTRVAPPGVRAPRPVDGDLPAISLDEPREGADETANENEAAS